MITAIRTTVTMAITIVMMEIQNHWLGHYPTTKSSRSRHKTPGILLVNLAIQPRSLNCIFLRMKSVMVPKRVNHIPPSPFNSYPPVLPPSMHSLMLHTNGISMS